MTSWRKSSFSENSQSDCVEVQVALAAVAVRDSKNITGPTLSFERRGWRTFLSSELTTR